MDLQTQRALGDLNRNFYESHASAFNAKRDHFWPGWQRVFGTCDSRFGSASALAVLDVGCGNGRLGDFLAGAWSGTLEYVGVDASEALLDCARSRFADASLGSARPRFVNGDLLALPPAELFASTGRADFDLCCAFGLLHHIPIEARRRALLEAMARSTRVGGFLAVSFWQFDAHERFRRRFRESPDVNRANGIELEQLDAGDHLVAWGTDDAVRYCHAASDEEIAAHASNLLGLGFRIADDFESDGRERNLNRYILFENLRAASD